MQLKGKQHEKGSEKSQQRCTATLNDPKNTVGECQHHMTFLSKQTHLFQLDSTDQTTGQNTTLIDASHRLRSLCDRSWRDLGEAGIRRPRGPQTNSNHSNQLIRQASNSQQNADPRCSMPVNGCDKHRKGKKH